MPPPTPSQTVGPFFAILVPERGDLRLRGGGAAGARIHVAGTVRDGTGRAVPDALIEIWQADAAGRYDHPEDPRRGGPEDPRRGGPEEPRPSGPEEPRLDGPEDARRGGPEEPRHCGSEEPRRGGPAPSFRGYGRVHTDPDGGFAVETVKPGRAPGPGGLQAPHLLVGLFARGVLARLVTRIYFDDEPSNAGDPVLALVPVDRRPTLVAESRGDGAYRFDIALQGPDETVFFDV